MRVLITVPHFYGGNQAEKYGSYQNDAHVRLQAVGHCLRSLRKTFASESYLANLERPQSLPANSLTTVDLQIVVCTTRDNHLLAELELPAGYVEHRIMKTQPMLLGFECHRTLREHLGQFDYYGYCEDDLVFHDPWVFRKLDWFGRLFGDQCLLQPNRYELATDGSSKKGYIDGDLPPEKTAPYQDVTDQPELHASFLGLPIVFRRTLNPHAGCFFLTAAQMAYWAGQRHFLDGNTAFYSPLESAATLGIMQSFRIYKPDRSCADFLEVRHAGDAWMRKIAQRDEEVRQHIAVAGAESRTQSLALR